MKKANKIPRTDMPCQEPSVRVKNFLEVATGYSKEQAMDEASRCLQCKNAKCVAGCPVEVRIPEFIGKVAEGDFAAAYEIIKSTNSLPAICGRVCPQETQCEGECILAKKGDAVAIGRLERFVADQALNDICVGTNEDNACYIVSSAAPKVACIGSGPASLTCASYLASKGIKVDVYEALHEAGGVLVYGIPEFRLPKSIVASELNEMTKHGVDFYLNWVGGRTITIEQLFAMGYQSVFIGVGAGLPYFLDVPGENLIGVFSANEYLTRANLGRSYAFPKYATPNYAGKNVTVFGAGNVAMDAARMALRMNADNVYIVYRRTKAEMPARHEEIEHAEEEGVKLLELCGPIEFNGDENGRLKSVHLQRMELGEPDASGRRSPKAIPGDTYVLDTDLAIIAVGTQANPILLEATDGLDLNRKGYIAVNEETNETSIPNVFAGGDIVTGAATVILAMGAGRKAAQEIAKRLGV